MRDSLVANVVVEIDYYSFSIAIAMVATWSYRKIVFMHTASAPVKQNITMGTILKRYVK